MYKLTSVVAFVALVAISFAANAQNSEITIGQVSADQGDQVEVPVTLDPNNHDISDFQIDIVFDDTELALGTNVDAVACGHVVNGNDLGSGHFLSCSVESANTLRVGVLSNPPTPSAVPEGEIMRVIFDVGGGTTPGTYTLQATNASAGDTGGSTVANADFFDGQISVSSGPSSVDFTPNPGSTIDFGSAEQNGGTSNDSVQICNDGSAGSVVNIDNVAITSGSAQFSQDGNCDSASLGDTDCCTVGLTFAPDGTGTFNGSLAIDTDAESGEGTNGDATFSLTGEGTLGPAPSLDITPASHDYGGVDTGLTSTQVFTVTNNGQAGSNAQLTAFAATGGEFSVIAGGTTCTVGDNLGQGASCDIEVEFAPTSPGEQTGQLEVDADDTENGVAMATETAALQGTGNGPIFSSDPGPGTHTLGTVPPGGSLNMDVVITNDGNEPLDASCGSLTDPDGVFTLTPDPADFTGIAGGASETFNVACDVPDVATYEATLQCSTNEDGTPTYDYTFRCSGQPLVIPTMQPWGLILLSLMMLAIGGFSIRFFRAG